MAFENLDLGDDMGTEGGTPPEESGNRMFLIAAGVLGAIAVLALVCIAIYALVVLPRNREQRAAQVSTLDAQNTEVASIINKTSTAAAAAALIAAYTPTPTATKIPPSPTPAPTATSVVVMVATTPPTLSSENMTATAVIGGLQQKATLTTAAATSLTPTATSTMPVGGFADELGLPVMVGVAVLLIVVIFLARRLRS